jgi:ribose transport system substrate-binding protein
METMKTWTAAALLWLAVIPAGAQTPRHVFAATYMTMNNPYFGAVDDGIRAVVLARGDKLITLDPELSQERQNAEVLDLIRQRVDAIFLNPVDWKAVRPALEAAARAHIPVINVDAPVFDQELVAAVVTSDNFRAGVLIAQDLQRRRPGARIVLLEHPGAKSAVDRISGASATFAAASRFRIVDRGTSNGQLEQALPAMTAILQRTPEVDAVVALNDPTALGAVEALERAGRQRGVLVYGVDGSPDAKRMIAEGRLTATAAQSPSKIGKTAAATAYALLSGQPVEKTIRVPVFLIDQSNVGQFDPDGWQ